MKEELRDDRLPYKKVNDFKDGGAGMFKEISSPDTDSSFILRKDEIVRVAKALGISNKDPVEVAIRAKKVFQNLKDVYGIPVALNIVMSENWNAKPSVDFLASKIEGETLSEFPDKMIWLDNMTESEKTRFISELDQLFYSLANYALENNKKNDFLWDIAPLRQYMWGKKIDKEGKKEGESHLYLVDVDLFTNSSYGEPMLSTFINQLAYSIERYGERLGIEFTRAREVIKNLIKEAGVSDPFRSSHF